MTANTHAAVAANQNEVEKLAAVWHAAHEGGHAAAATFADIRAHSIAFGADNYLRSLEQVAANEDEVERLSAAWHAHQPVREADNVDYATEAENVAAIASARAGLVRAEEATSSEAEVAAATDAADAVIAACRPLSLAGAVDMLSLMIESDGGAFISDGLLSGLAHLRWSLARLVGEAECDALVQQEKAAA